MDQREIVRYVTELGLDLNGQHTPEDVKKAWRTKCLEHHPDKGGDPKKFMDVTHAYKMLTDPSYRDGQDKGKPKKHQLDIQIVVPVKFEDAFFGTKLTATWNRIEFNTDMTVMTKENLEVVTISTPFPPGHLQDFHYQGRGLGARMGELQGDAVIVFRPVPSPKFQVRGQDVLAEEEIELDILLKGGEVEVQTMYGLKTLKVPAGTQPGAELKIRKCGVRQRGDHIVVCSPLFPSADELKSKDSWKGLDINWAASEEAEAKQNEQDQQFETVFINLGGYTYTGGS